MVGSFFRLDGEAVGDHTGATNVRSDHTDAIYVMMIVFFCCLQLTAKTPSRVLRVQLRDV